MNRKEFRELLTELTLIFILIMTNVIGVLLVFKGELF